MMWEKDMFLEEHRRRTPTMNMHGMMEEMTYVEEGGRAADIIVEPTENTMAMMTATTAMITMMTMTGRLSSKRMGKTTAWGDNSGAR